MFEHFDRGSTVEEFLEWFPSVSRAQVHGVLTFTKSTLEQPAAICVKVLFDANTPSPIDAVSPRTSSDANDELGWQGLDNGALLDVAERVGFEVLLTCDQNVRKPAKLPAGRSLLVSVKGATWLTATPSGSVSIVGLLNTISVKHDDPRVSRKSIPQAWRRRFIPARSPSTLQAAPAALAVVTVGSASSQAGLTMAVK